MSNTVAAAQQDSTKATSPGTLDRIKVHGKSLEGNLAGDTPNRDVSVYLPPSYSTEKSRTFPVIYMLHGGSVNSQGFGDRMLTVLDKAISTGASKEMIVVMPNADTAFLGSFFGNSVTTGDWEHYISRELVSYIDTHYRTVVDRTSRGLAGHSMGGYGTIRIGMKYPEIFSAIYALSPCCLDVGRTVRSASVPLLRSNPFALFRKYARRLLRPGHCLLLPRPSHPLRISLLYTSIYQQRMAFLSRGCSPDGQRTRRLRS